MSQRRKRIWAGLCSTLVAAAMLDACASPTQIRVRVHTNVPCTDQTQWKGVALYAGAPGSALENKAPTLTTTDCDARGLVGTLVIVPSGSKNEEVGLRVVGGIARAPEECAEHDYEGCIVARREVRFTRHETLELDVALTSECVSVGCDENRTCVAGRCVETEAVPATPAQLPDAGSPLVDAGEPMVRCGDNGVFCPTTGDVCCLTVDRNAGTTSGECKQPATCQSSSIVLNCDDESDCTDYAIEDSPGVCVVSYTEGPVGSDPFLPVTVEAAHCMTYTAFQETVILGLELCQTREKGCINGRFQCVRSTGDPTPALPGYFWCQLTR